MEQNLDIWVKISQQIGELTSSVKGVLDRLTEHENRLTSLEQKKEEDSGWKTQLIMLLAKATVIGLVSIGSLVGAGSIMAKVLGTEAPAAVQEAAKK